MDLLNNTINFSIDFGLMLPLITFSMALIVSYLSYPIIIKVVKEKNLMAEPCHRDVHSTKTPNLGGIGIFLATYLIISFLGFYFEGENLLNLTGAITIMFFVGLVDDLVGIRPKSKLIGQVVVGLFMIFMTDLRIESFYGVLGIYELPYVISVLTTTMVFVTIINAYNLIDGVDGLAGTFAITANLFFAGFFYFNGNYFMSFLSIGIVGALAAFLVFNFSKENKIFMGDTGSMLVGFLLAYQAINFMSADLTSSFGWLDTKALVYFLAIFTYPLIDTARVFFIRIKAGNSPFTADNNHIHHNFLGFGLKHWEISIISALFTVFTVSTLFVFNNLEVNQLVLVLAAIWLLSATLIDNLSLFLSPAKLQTNINEINFDGALVEKEAKVIYLNKTA